MKRSSIFQSILLIVLLILSAFSSGFLPAPRQTFALGTLPQTANNRFSLRDLKLDPINLTGPLQTGFVSFGLPADWKPTGGAQLVLRFETSVPGFQELISSPTNSETVQTKNPTGAAAPRFGGNLRVVMNNVPISTIPLNQNGARAVSIPIPTQALSATQDNGQHYVAFILDDTVQCGKNDQTSVTIQPDSTLVLPHASDPLTPDLTLLPRPLYMRSYQSEQAILVLPDQPTPNELEAAFNIAAGFGRMTQGGLGISLTTTSRLDPTARDQSHLILVGKAASLPQLIELKLPLPLDGKGFNAAQAEDGVLQILASPYNPARVVLVASGAADVGVANAGRALSSGNVRAAGFTNFAIIASGQGTAAPLTNLVTNADFSLGDLGYESTQLQGGGTQLGNYTFSLPEGAPADDAYIDLSFVHSALLDYDRSLLSVVLNGNNVGSIRLSDNSTRLTRARIAIPADRLRAGENRVQVRAEMTHRDACVLNGSGLWLTIQPDTLLHVSVKPTAPNAVRRFNLGLAASTLKSKPDLSNAAFVVGAQDIAGWNTAAKIAFGLGQDASEKPMNTLVAFVDNVPNTVRGERDLILVGRATTVSALVNELNNFLPAPFAQGSDVASERDASVQYRVAKDADVGYLQLLAAPWQPLRNVLAVMGTTDKGVASAGEALFNPKVTSKLFGNLAFISGEQVTATDNQKVLPRAGVVDAGTNPAQPAAPATTASVSPSDVSLPAIIAVSVGVLLLILAVAAIAFLGRRRTVVANADEED